MEGPFVTVYRYVRSLTMTCCISIRYYSTEFDGGIVVDSMRSFSLWNYLEKLHKNDQMYILCLHL